jgi:hypothetical protein
MKEEQLEIEQVEASEIPEDQAAFLKSLEAEEAQEDFNPEQSKAEEKAQEIEADMAEQAAQMTAMGGLATIEFALKRFIHKDFEFTTDTKAYAIENLSPVLVKYGALLPAWLAAYDAEIKAAMAVGSLVSEGVTTAQSLKAQDIEKAKEAAKNDDDQQTEKERVRVAA